MKPLLIIITCSILAGCSSTSIKYLKSEQFLKEAACIEIMNSAFFVDYIGSSQGRVYLEKNIFSLLPFRDSVTIVYWTNLNDLPADIVNQIRSGKSPWTSPEFKQNTQLFDEMPNAIPGLKIDLLKEKTIQPVK